MSIKHRKSFFQKIIPRLKVSDISKMTDRQKFITRLLTACTSDTLVNSKTSTAMTFNIIDKNNPIDLFWKISQKSFFHTLIKIWFSPRKKEWLDHAFKIYFATKLYNIEERSIFKPIKAFFDQGYMLVFAIINGDIFCWIRFFGLDQQISIPLRKSWMVTVGYAFNRFFIKIMKNLFKLLFKDTPLWIRFSKSLLK